MFPLPPTKSSWGAVSSSSTWVSPTSQVFSNTSWRMQILLLLTSQGQWWSQVFNAAWSSALPSALAGKAQGKRHPWPCQLLFLHQFSHPSKVCTWGITLARLLRSLPPALCRPLAAVPICGLLSCEQPEHWIVGWFVQPDLGQRLPCPAATPDPSGAGSDKDYSDASGFMFYTTSGTLHTDAGTVNSSTTPGITPRNSAF